MLALLAALVLVPSRSDPFVSSPLEPILPIAALKGHVAHRIARSTSWRTGSVTRITHYYQFGTSLDWLRKSLEADPEFRLEAETATGAWRMGRVRGNLRQVISANPLKDGEEWRWAEVKGPSWVATVTHIRLNDGIPVDWPAGPEFERPYLPPSFPPFGFLSRARLVSVTADAPIPRNARIARSLEVFLTSTESYESLVASASREIDPSEFKMRFGSKRIIYSRLGYAFDLQHIQISRSKLPGVGAEILLSYRFAESKYGPRLE